MILQKDAKLLSAYVLLSGVSLAYKKHSRQCFYALTAGIILILDFLENNALRLSYCDRYIG